MTPTCINLHERFGSKYRITFDEAYDPSHRPGDKLDPWYMEIPCRRGTVYPQGGNRLAVMVDGYRGLVKQMRQLPYLEIVQDGQSEATFVFDVADFDKVAELVKPWRKPRMSDEQRLAAADRLREFRFQPGRVTATPLVNGSRNDDPQKDDISIVQPV